VRRETVSGTLADDARLGADNCPEDAIEVDEEE
jgi:ferredoxin